MFSTLKESVFTIIHPHENERGWNLVFDLSIIALILLNLIIVIAETFPIQEELSLFFSRMESLIVWVFTLEYFLRVWTADKLRPDLTPLKARLRYTVSGMAIIDLLAILPYYIPFLFTVDLKVLRTMRVLRLLRLVKISRYTDAMSAMTKVLRSRGHQLLSSFSALFLFMLVASILMYYVEHPEQPDVFENALSGLWWAIITITTVGYGDIYPVTTLGRIISGVIAVLGIALVAVPSGIISAGLMEQIEESRTHEAKHFCPYCGKKLD